jgi:hypothetical protein
MTIYNPTTAQSITRVARNFMLPVIRNILPAMIARDILGVQPMTGDTGSIFSIEYKKDTRVWSKKKYKFSRAKWYEASFIDDYDDVRQWCIEHFGPHPRKPDAWSRWNHKYEYKILFRDEDDYILFVLKWGKQ